MKHPKRALPLLGAVLALSLSAPPLAARAESPVPAARDGSGQGGTVAEREAYWRARAAAARKRLAAAEAKLKRANGDVSRMRRRNHPRGDGRAALFAQRAAARAEHEQAVRVLEVELPREARNARADLDWLTD